MKHLLILFVFCFSGSVTAQPQNPVIWQTSYSAVSETEGDIVITGTIEKGWHTYSIRPTDAGPIPTSFTFTPSKEYELVGGIVESDAHEEFVPAFDAKIFVFSGKAVFRQKIRRKSKGVATIPVVVEYMTCNDMMCLPPKTVKLTAKAQ
jgi:DsbC/DsbD-like thiol-disulfide interchange protein